MEKRSGKLHSLAMVLVALAGIGASLVDVFGVGPGITGKFTPLLLGVLILYLVADRSRLNRTKQIARNMDRNLKRLRDDLKKDDASKPAQSSNNKKNRNKKRNNQRGNKKKVAPQPNPANYREFKWRGLTFRSVSEMRVAQELDKAGVLFLSSSKVRFKTETSRQSREVDFLICDEGRWGVLEVDGPHHSSTEDEWRDDRLREHGVELVKRYDARWAFSNPRAVVLDFLAALDGVESDDAVDDETPENVEIVEAEPPIPPEPIQPEPNGSALYKKKLLDQPRHQLRLDGKPQRQRPERKHYARRRR